jgi:hypothetical protein
MFLIKHISVYLSVCLSIYLSIYQSVCLSVYISISLCVCVRARVGLCLFASRNLSKHVYYILILTVEKWKTCELTQILLVKVLIFPNYIIINFYQHFYVIIQSVLNLK